MANPIILNNDALGLFAAGNHREAECLLQNALGELRSRLALPRQFGGNVAGTRRTLLLKSVPSLWSPSDNLKDNCSGITFFDRTFLVSTGDIASSAGVENDHETDCKTCALILYNLGVTRHLEGIMTDQQDVLESSYRFYGMAVEFLQMHFLESVSPYKFDDSLLLLSMALMNNIAHIQSGRFEYGETDHCIKWLRQAANQIDTSLLQDVDHMFFFLRYYVVPTNQISSAAAA